MRQFLQQDISQLERDLAEAIADHQKSRREIVETAEHHHSEAKIAAHAEKIAEAKTEISNLKRIETSVDRLRERIDDLGQG
jgi:predicted nuclease with TOPRIM domain